MVNVAAKSQPTGGAAYRLDRNSAMPLYHQLFIDLRRRLLEGEWQPGDPFLKDSEIEEAYAVSRITVRQAMSQLVDGNFIARYRGRGSFVGNLPKTGSRINHRTIGAEIEALGRVASFEHMSYEQHVVSEMTARQLDIAVGAEVGILKRLHKADGAPFCLESIMLSVREFPNVFDRVLEGEETLTAAYQRLGIDVVKCDQTVNAVMLSEERRGQLGLRDDAPALFVERVGYSPANRPLDVRRLHYRTDVFSLRQEIIWGSADNRIT